MFSPQKNDKLCDVTEVLTKATVVIILQYVNVSNQHIVHFKLTCYMSNIAQFKK